MPDPSFTSFIPEFEASMDRLNQGRKRPAPSRGVNDFEVARQSQRNEMFFTDEDDEDSLFGADDIAVVDIAVVERNDPRNRQSQPQSQPVRGVQPQPRQNVQSNANVTHRQDFNDRTNRPVNNSMRPLVPKTNAPPPSTVTTTTTTIPPPIQIKDEESDMEANATSDYLRSIPASQRVKIFVGRKNRSITVNRTDLSKSPTLLSYIVNDPIQGSFIMRPQLMTTHYDDFIAVAQFLRTAEYAPSLLDNPTDLAGPKILNGLKSDEEYAKELVKSGKLYGLAREFGVEGMSDLVYRKVNEVDTGKFSINSLVRVAEVVFKDRTNGNGDVEGGDTKTKDPLEEWIVGRLAYNFQEIMRTQREKFFEVVRITGKKMLFARVLEEVAMKYRASGGRLPEPVIELD